MKTNIITAVGIDVSKAKSTVAARCPGGEVALMPFEVTHDAESLRKLAATLHELDGEVSSLNLHTCLSAWIAK